MKSMHFEEPELESIFYDVSDDSVVISSEESKAENK
jgi:hypothetical protein